MQTEHREANKWIKLTIYQMQNSDFLNWRNSTEYSDIKMLFPTKDIHIKKCVKHIQPKYD